MKHHEAVDNTHAAVDNDCSVRAAACSVSRSVVSRSVWPITALKPFPSLLASRVEAEVSGL